MKVRYRFGLPRRAAARLAFGAVLAPLVGFLVAPAGRCVALAGLPVRAPPALAGLALPVPLAALNAPAATITGAHDDNAASFSYPQRPIPTRLHGLSRFVVTRGGEYCFMPGLRALRWLAEPRR
jgi:hypothetical protein